MTNPLPRTEHGDIDCSASYGELWLVEVTYNTDPEGNWVDEVINAYHHGEIAQALSALTFTQRQQVFARFWLGMSEPEIAALQGVSVSSVSRRWTQEIKPQLVGQLGHLVDTVC